MSENVVGLTRKRSEIVEIPGFGAGARVQLKCGGLEMVVREAKTPVNGKPMVVCEWQLQDGTPASFDYFVDQLWRIERFPIDG
jgi:uncharacterized protein YodC (DUF2158 family)